MNTWLNDFWLGILAAALADLIKTTSLFLLLDVLLTEEAQVWIFGKDGITMIKSFAIVCAYWCLSYNYETQGNVGKKK